RDRTNGQLLILRPGLDTGVAQMVLPQQGQHRRHVQQVSHGNSSIALRVSSQLIGRFEDKSNRPFLRTSFALGRAGFSTRVSTIWLGPMTSGIQESLGRAGAGSVTRLRLSECNTCMLWV